LNDDDGAGVIRVADCYLDRIKRIACLLAAAIVTAKFGVEHVNARVLGNKLALCAGAGAEAPICGGQDEEGGGAGRGGIEQRPCRAVPQDSVACGGRKKRDDGLRSSFRVLDVAFGMKGLRGVAVTSVLNCTRFTGTLRKSTKPL